MDAGKRMLEEAQRRAAATARTACQATPVPSAPSKPNTSTTTLQPPITPIDLTLILQFPSTSTLSEGLQDRLTSSYGPINHVFIKDPPEVEGKKKKKGKKAIVEFKEGNWGGCWACWRDLEGGKEGCEGVKVKWAGGATPDWVAWSETHRPSRPPAPAAEPGRDTNTDTNTNTNTTTSRDTPLPTFTSAPNFGSTTMSDLLASHSQSRTDQVNKKKREDEFESMTLLKMRQMERERLIEEIRREEEA
jgi:DnaJ family protein C protein 17